MGSVLQRLAELKRSEHLVTLDDVLREVYFVEAVAFVLSSCFLLDGCEQNHQC